MTKKLIRVTVFECFDVTDFSSLARLVKALTDKLMECKQDLQLEWDCGSYSCCLKGYIMREETDEEEKAREDTDAIQKRISESRDKRTFEELKKKYGW